MHTGYCVPVRRGMSRALPGEGLCPRFVYAGTVLLILVGLLPGMSAAQSFNISDELNVAKEIDVTDYVTRKLKGRQNADAQTVRRYQIAGAVLGAIALFCLAVWIFQSQ